MNSTYWLNTVMNTMYAESTTEFWVGLSATLPNKDGTGISEPVGGGYTRVRLPEFSEAVDGTVKNIDDIKFPRSFDTWFSSENKAKYWVLFNGSGSGARFLSSGELDEPKTVEGNTMITIAAETLSVTLTDYQLPA